MDSEPQCCERCGEEIEDRPDSKFRPSDLRTCDDCWFGELDGEERKQYAKEAHKRRDQRLNA